MNVFRLSSDRTALGVTQTGAHLSDVTFTLDDGRSVRPMHTAPWYGEALPADATPMLRILRGDFFCAPFGASDVIAGETRAHGRTASGEWLEERRSESELDAVLDGDVMGATVHRHVELRPGETMAYQRHVFEGGAGRIPVGHHAMLKAERPLRLGFAPARWAGTPPDPIEVPPNGRSLLAYPQEIGDPAVAMLADGGRIDLTTYPVADDHEDLWMMAAKADAPFAWTAATCADEGWVWFTLKDPRVLPSTVFWLSNGGRNYPPFSGRHRRVIGIEDVCAYFNLGHAASIADNPLSSAGVHTAVVLRPDSELVISHAFGLASAPAGFGAVAEIAPADGGIVLRDFAGRETFARCDPGFVTAGPDAGGAS